MTNAKLKELSARLKGEERNFADPAADFVIQTKHGIAAELDAIIAELDRKRYVDIDIELAQDGPVQGLLVGDENGGYRLTNAKASGHWKTIRVFKCHFDLSEFLSYDKAAAPAPSAGRG